VLLQGALVGVVGEVGCGKSSLISSILADMRRSHGRVSVLDVAQGFSLCSQEPWLQHASIRDNILFGQNMNTRKYQQTVSACALEDDFALLPGGDRTEVGERGVTLSGGQKARIALARAVYQVCTVHLSYYEIVKVFI
jgi:ATP-binding cassette subfamily C (CFTR/MRP) protein 10